MLIQRNGQKGAALILVLSFSVAILTIAALSSQLVNRSQTNTQEEFRRKAQATNIARAGLKEALGWFKLKSSSGGAVAGTEPCVDAAFAPEYHADPRLRATDDPVRGIVKDILLNEDRNVYGRYIIRKQPCGSGADPNYTPDDAGYEPLAAHDITHLKSPAAQGSGLIWRLTSEGIVYVREDKSKNSDGVFLKGPEETPNRVLDREVVSIEINRLNLAAPSAPVNIMDPIFGNHGKSRFNNKCQVTGNGADATVIYVSNDPNGNTDCQYEDCSGARDNKRQQISEFIDPMTLSSVFGVNNLYQVRSLADDVFTSKSDLVDAYYNPAVDRLDLPMSLYFLEGNFTFDSSKPLLGRGVLVVDGDLKLEDDAFNFAGLVYVTGRLEMKNNNEISGASFASEYRCEPGVKAVFEFNRGIIESVRDAVALYRENTVTFHEGR